MKTFEELSLAEPEPQAVREGDTNDHREERVEADSVPLSQDLCGLAFTRMEYFIGSKAASEMLKPRGRPKAAVTKTHVNLRLDAEVLEAFKATGPGWQTRINKALREWLREKGVRKSQGN